MKECIEKITKMLFFSIVVFSVMGCPDKGDINKDIIIKNKSKNDIFVFVCDTQYSEDCTGELSEIKRGVTVKKDETFRFHYGRFEETMYLFILNMEVVNSYSWAEIVASKNYLKRYEFDGAKELDKINWTITYP